MVHPLLLPPACGDGVYQTQLALVVVTAFVEERIWVWVACDGRIYFLQMREPG